MNAGGSPLLANPEEYAQALGVLKREGLSPRDLQLFLWLVNVTAAAFLLSVVWVVIVLVGFGAQRIVLFAATGFHLAVVGFVLMNAPLFWKLFAASRLERALQLTRPLRAIAALEPGAWSRRLGGAVLIAIAAVAFYWGIVGFSVWSAPEANWIGRLGAICSVSLGFSCALIYLVDRARRRQRALSRLQAAIDDAKDGVIDTVYYDAIVCLERAQIVQDREDAVLRASARPMPVIRMADEFREQLKGLDVADATAATAMVRTLSLAEANGGDGKGTCPLRPGLSLDYLRRRGGKEILLLGLTATERGHHA